MGAEEEKRKENYSLAALSRLARVCRYQGQHPERAAARAVEGLSGAFVLIRARLVQMGRSTNWV